MTIGGSDGGCSRQDADVSCDNGRRSIWSGDAIVWADGTRSGRHFCGICASDTARCR
jgi:hypothetical protein